MDMRIFKNSYIVSIMMFIIFYVVFYFAGIGFAKVNVNGKIIQKYSWKYPLACALVIWLIWHYYLYPVPDDVIVKSVESISSKATLTNLPRINMAIWH